MLSGPTERRKERLQGKEQVPGTLVAVTANQNRFTKTRVRASELSKMEKNE